MRLIEFLRISLLTHLIVLGAIKSPKARNPTVTPQTLAVRRIPENDFFLFRFIVCMHVWRRKFDLFVVGSVPILTGSDFKLSIDGTRNLSFTECQLVQFVKIMLKLQGKRESTWLWKYLSLEHKANRHNFSYHSVGEFWKNNDVLFTLWNFDKKSLKLYPWKYHL